MWNQVSSENDDNSSESSKFQEDVLDTQELSYSVDLCDFSESDQSESDESIPDIFLLKPYDFEPLVKKFQKLRIFKLQRQRLNVLVIETSVNVGYVNQWKARLKILVVWTQMKFLMIILKVLISFISFIISFITEAATRGVLWKKVFFKMLQNLQENTCTRVSSTGVFLWILQHFKEHIFSQNTSGRLLLLLRYQIYCYQIYYKEFFIFREKCVTLSEGFKTVYLTKNVLKTALWTLNNLLGYNLTDTSNCAYRYVGYK